VALARDRHEIVAVASIVVLALASSLTSITNKFAFDDAHIISQNPAVHSLAGWWRFFGLSYWPPELGGDLYRPLTILSFALQWAAGDGSPLIFHATNIVLYALVCAAFFGVVAQLLPRAGAWVAGALFAVHPLHVEVVGNVVGQGELWAALFMLLGLHVFLRGRIRGSFSRVEAVGIVICYVLAMISKEHSILFPLLLAAAEITVIPRTRSLRARITELRPLLLALAASGLLFLWARISVLAISRGVPPEPPMLFVGEPYGVRAVTMMGVVLEWLRLLLWPAELSADYSPRHIDLFTGLPLVPIVGAVILAAVAAIGWQTRRSFPVVTFAILWLGIALLIPSNLIVLTGVVLAERTLFLATAPAMLAIGFCVARMIPDVTALSPVARRVALSAVGIVLALGVARSAIRQRVWRDNPTLFEQTVRDAPTSSNARLYYAGVLLEQRKIHDMFDELGLAHRLWPKNVPVLEFAAAQYAQAQSCPLAAKLFREALRQEPRRLRSRTGLASCLITMGHHAEARTVIRQGLGLGEPEYALRQLRQINDSVERASRTNITGASSTSRP
jgi:hypothetical protein